MTRNLIALATALIALCALPAKAQNLTPPTQPQSALTIYGGYGGGGSFDQTSNGGVIIVNPNANANVDSNAVGAASIDWRYDRSGNGQIFASYQRANLDLPTGVFLPSGANSFSLDIAYLQLGGVRYIGGTAGQGAYYAGGIGATFLSPRNVGLSSEVRPSVSLAFGYEHEVNPTLSIRGELRGFATLFNSNGAIFCSGGCTIALQGNTFLQGQALLGLSLRF